MITKWYYDANDGGIGRTEVKNILSETKYNCIDVGAGVLYWSYPECLNVADILPRNQYRFYGLESNVFPENDSRIKEFILNLHDTSTWKELLDYTDKNGKFDYSICSHTLEDIYNPFDVIKLLEKISKRGFIAIPSKYDELSVNPSGKFRGYPHHKYIFNIKEDNKLLILPKSSFIENEKRSDLIAEKKGGQKQLCIFWEDTINFELHSFEPIFSDEQLIDSYFKMLENEN